MDRREKMEMLQKLSEEELTKKFLIPLYDSEGMGCKNVQYTHGILEFGKDIVYYREDEYGNRIYTGVQVKKTKITAKSIGKLVSQTVEAFGEPFTNLSDGKKKDLDQFVVLTSNKISEEAKVSFWASLRGARLDKLIRCIDGHQLVALVENHLPSALWKGYDYSNKYYSVTITKFEEMLNKSELQEVDFKQFFINNPWLLEVGIKYKEILQEQKAGSRFRVDFLLKTFEDYYDIMELKKHTDTVIVGSDENWKISAKCENGISQLYRYIEYYEQNVAKEHYERGIDPYKPSGFLVIGRSKNKDIKRKIRSINSRYQRMEILTYDDLYERAKRWIEFKMQEV